MMRLGNTRNLIDVVTVVFCIYVMSGGFFNVIVQPGGYVTRYQRVYTIDPDMSGQTNSESVKAFMCNATTTIGVFAMARSHNSKNHEIAYRVLLIGLVLIGSGMMGSYYLLEMKRMAVPIG